MEETVKLSSTHAVSASTGRWYDIVKDFSNLWDRISREINVLYGKGATIESIDEDAHKSISEVAAFLEHCLSESVINNVLHGDDPVL